MSPLLELSNRLSRIEARLAGMVRHGPVKEVNAAEGWVRLDLGGGLLSPKLPYAQVAGGLKIHAPPTEGQQMTAIAPGGDPTQAIALPMTWSDANASPSESGEENVLTYGSVRIELRGDEILATVGGASLRMESDAVTISIGGVSWTLSGSGEQTTGGQVKHNSKNIGDTHRHGDVMPGPAPTGVPI